MLSCAVKLARTPQIRVILLLLARVLDTGGLHKHMFYDVFVCATKAEAIVLSLYARLWPTSGRSLEPRLWLGGPDMMLYALFSCCRRIHFSFEKVWRTQLLYIYMRSAPLGRVHRAPWSAWNGLVTVGYAMFVLFGAVRQVTVAYAMSVLLEP